MTNWIESFESYFSVKIADTPELLEQAMKVRYEMYCLENNFEDAEKFKNQLESDTADQNSIHSILIYRPTNTVVGTVRLILPRLGKAFPMEEHCPITWAEEYKTGHNILHYADRGKMAEISRFSISHAFRKRVGESKSTHGIVDNKESLQRLKNRRLIPHLSVGLVRGLFELSHLHDRSTLLAVMEPTLRDSMLKRYHTAFYPIGPTIEFRGLRQPYIADIASISSYLKSQDLLLWQFLTDHGRFVSHLPSPQPPTHFMNLKPLKSTCQYSVLFNL